MVSSAQWDSPVFKTLTLEITAGVPSPDLQKVSHTFCYKNTLSGAEDLATGVADIAQAFSTLTQVIDAYDSWMNQAQTHELGVLEQDDTKYQIMMRKVEEERASVPVVLYAMIDQVRNRVPVYVQEFRFQSLLKHHRHLQAQKALLNGYSKHFGKTSSFLRSIRTS